MSSLALFRALTLSSRNFFKFFFLHLAERMMKHCRSSRTRGGMNKTPSKHLQNTEKHNTNQNTSNNHKKQPVQGERVKQVWNSETFEALSYVELQQEAIPSSKLPKHSHVPNPETFSSQRRSSYFSKAMPLLASAASLAVWPMHLLFFGAELGGCLFHFFSPMPHCSRQLRSCPC